MRNIVVVILLISKLRIAKYWNWFSFIFRNFHPTHCKNAKRWYANFRLSYATKKCRWFSSKRSGNLRSSQTRWPRRRPSKLPELPVWPTTAGTAAIRRIGVRRLRVQARVQGRTNLRVRGTQGIRVRRHRRRSRTSCRTCHSLSQSVW